MKRKIITVFFIICSIILCIDTRPCFSDYFIDDFNTLNISNWDYIFKPENSTINSDSGILNIVASPLFQDDPESSVILRKWIIQDSNVFTVSARLRISNFDRFAFSVDHTKVTQYYQASEMFGFHFRSAGGGYQIVTINGKNGALRYDGIEGAILSDIQTNQWYMAEMEVLEEPFIVTFTIKDDAGNLLVQQTENGASLSHFTYEDMKSVGFSLWTSTPSSLGDIDIDWVSIDGAKYSEPRPEPINQSIIFETETSIPISLKITLNLSYERVDLPVEDANVRINGIKAENLGEGYYSTTVFTPSPFTSIKAEITRTGSPSFVSTTDVLHMGNLIFWTIIILVVITAIILIISKRKRKTISLKKTNEPYVI